MATKKDLGVHQQMKCLDARVRRLEGAVFPAPVCRPNMPKAGATVCYRHRDSERATWRGVVIARPVWCRELGLDGPLVWVVREDTNKLVGVYPWNLREVKPCY